MFVDVSQHKTGVINDPLGQTHSHSSFLLFCFSRFEKWGRTDGRTDGQQIAKTIISAGRDFGLAEWINNTIHVCQYLKLLFVINNFCFKLIKRDRE